jgi:D-alanine-D-alanine ligase
MYLEIITTPNDDMKESGFGSLKACNNVLNAIQDMGHQVLLSVCESRQDLINVVIRKPDLVILAVKYATCLDEDDIWLADFFSDNGINYTGSSREVLEFDSNKVLAKTHLMNKGISTAKYFMAVPGQYKKESELPFTFPLFLKPLNAANGNGIDDLSFVTSFIEYEAKVTSLYDSFQQPILIEEYLDGREFTVAVIQADDEKIIVSAVELIPPVSSNGLKILGAKAKKDDSEKMIEIDNDDIKQRVSALAVEAFNSLGVRDFGRIDIKSNTYGDLYFMEANLVPGMTFGSSYFPQACKLANGLSYKVVVDRILQGGLARAELTLPPNKKSNKVNQCLTAL